MDRSLWQRDVAEELGVSEAAVHNWEVGHADPSIRAVSRIIGFLGCDPYSNPGGTLSDQIRSYRRRLGFSRKVLAEQLGMDEGTLARWETGIGRPGGQRLARLLAVLNRARHLR
jgi:DNA-binding transcriptional regulator YiaG